MRKGGRKGWSDERVNRREGQTGEGRDTGTEPRVIALDSSGDLGYRLFVQ